MLAAVLLLSGCTSKANPASSVAGVKDTDATSTTTAETTIIETTKEPEPFTFNPHLHCSLLSEIVTEDMWGSLYNMIDAIRAGEDTFKCTDENAYKWCTDDVTIGSFLPAACTLVVGDGYENGVGKLKYKVDKDKFLEREKAFEEEIVRIINEATKSDRSDFEKLMGLYDYMCKYWVYDYNELDGQGIDDFSDYACLTKKDGICCEIAGAFSYLLLQCGVEALKFTGGSGSSSHAWSYVTIDGAGYFIDPTWGISERGSRELAYFMTTDSERLFYFDKYMGPQIFYYDFKNKDVDFSASDDRYAPLHNGKAVSMNRKSKILKYSVDGRIREFHYDTQNE